jgi:hypothetical protein
VRLIPAQFVRPFVKSNQNDYCEAEAIASAAEREKHAFRAPTSIGCGSGWSREVQSLSVPNQLTPLLARSGLGGTIGGTKDVLKGL